MHVCVWKGVWEGERQGKNERMFVNLSICGVCVYTWDGSEGVWNPTQGARQWESSHLLPNMGIACARFPFFPLAFPFPFSFRQFLRKKKENILIWIINYSSNFDNQTGISIQFPINDWKYFNYFNGLNWKERKEKKLLGSFLSACHFIQCVTWVEWQPWRDGVTNNLNLRIGISPELFYLSLFLSMFLLSYRYVLREYCSKYNFRIHPSVCSNADSILYMDKRVRERCQYGDWDCL